MSVPMFKMRPQVGSLILAFFVLLMGGGIYFFTQQDITNPDGQAMGKLVLAISIVISGLLVIVSTARMWFLHLWHQRKYK